MTALTATALPEAAAIRLDITGAPIPAAPIVDDDFTVAAEATAWEGTTRPPSLPWVGTLTADGRVRLRQDAGDEPIGTVFEWSRDVTGLTAGQRYRVALEVAVETGSYFDRATIGENVAGAAPWSTITTGAAVQLVYDFTAAGTTATVVLQARTSGRAINMAVLGDNFTVTPVAATPPPATTILRVDANGARPVRLREGQEPIAGTMTITDYEAALVGPIRYDLTDSAGGIVTVSTTLEELVELPQLVVARLPQYRAAVQYVTGYTAARESTATVHDVIARTDPVVSLGVLRMRRGALTCWVPDYAGVAALESLAGLGQILHLRQPSHAGMDMYFAPGRTSPEYVDGRWLVSIDYVELAPPSGPLLGDVGWTYDDVATGYATYAQLRDAFPTYAALAIGAVSA